MKELKLMLKYRKNGRLNSATISLNQTMIKHLGNIMLSFFYQNKEIILSGNNETETYEKAKNGKIIELKRNIKLQSDRKLDLPLGILDDLGVNLEKENKVQIEFLDNHKLKLKLINLPILEKKESTKMGEIITVKVNKGGVGKTFITVQLGAYLALQEKKVLLLTSDSQNNIIDYCFGERIEFAGGLKEFVKSGTEDIIKLRKNLFFIPLESSTFGAQFLLKLPSILEELKKKYDYILIDSIPTMKIDSTFVACSDKIIIPTFCDRVTTEGVLNVVDETGVDKVLAVMINKYEDKKIQNLYKNELIEATKNTDILFPNPIPNTSEIEVLLHKGKTIWESKSKKILEIQSSFKEIGDYIIDGMINKNKFNINF
ncbi:ParA family protein [Fusobacterium sp. SYSU M8A802]